MNNVCSILDAISKEWGEDFEDILLSWLNEDTAHSWESAAFGFFCYDGYTT